MSARSKDKAREEFQNVFEAINAIRGARNRPDYEAVVSHVCTKHGLRPADVGSTVAQMQKLHKIECKTYEDGRQSYFIIEEIDLENTESKASSNCEPSGAKSHTAPTPKPSEPRDSTGLANTPASKANSFNGLPEIEKPSELVSAFTTMANSVNNLNNLIQVERTKSEKLMTENFTLKMRIIELESLVENILGSRSSAKEKTAIETPLSKTQKTLSIRTNLINQSDEYNKTVCNMQNQTPGSEALGNKIHNQVNGQMSQKSKRARKANNKGRAQRKQPEATSLIDLTTTNKTTDTTDKGQKSNKRTKVTVVGDSQLSRLDENKLCNQNREVKIQGKSGMRLNQVAKSTGKTDSDVIIVHVGTNNLKTSSPQELSTGILASLKKIQENNPDAKIAYSSIFRRKDELNKTAVTVNKLVSDELMLNGFDFIDNDDILFSNLARDGLHINTGGARKFASNLSRFIKYC